MTLPSIRDSATHISAVNETFRAVMPTDVEEGDMLVVHFSGDGNLATLQPQTGDFQGWNLIYSQVVSGTLVAGAMMKPADGTEGGLTLFPAASPSEKWCVSAIALDNVDLYAGGGFISTFASSGANPDQAAVSDAGWGGDVMFLTALAGEGATATTASPSGYTTEHTLNNGAADGASLRVAHKTGILPENPGAWTRASTAWIAQLYAHYGDNPTAPKHQRLRNQKTEILSGGTKNYTVTIPSGPARRFFALFHAASSTVSVKTLDPGGSNETELIPVSDGVNNAETAAAGVSRAATWYEVFPVPPPGTYTLRITSSVTTDVALHSATMLNAEQRPGAHSVLNASGSGAAASGNLSIPRFGMVMTGAVQPLSASPTDFIWNPLTQHRAHRSSWNAPHYCSMLARRVASASPLAITIGAPGASLVQAFSAFSVPFYEDNPIWASTDF